MESYLLEHEAALRVSLFLLVLAAMAGWEYAAPARPRREPWWRRWRTNLGVAVFNTLVLRVALPSTAIGVAELAAAQKQTAELRTRVTEAKTELITLEREHRVRAERQAAITVEG